MNARLRFIVTAATIAALYAVITIVFIPLSFGPVQLRISEILTVLPFFTPAAIPGLFVGCILGNIASPFGPVDIAIGSIATLLAACLSHIMPKKWLVPLPPVILNGVFVGTELHYLLGLPLLPTILYVALGEAIVCYLGGMTFMVALEKIKGRLF
jgi:uncharacterized membrane protein